MLAPRHYLKIHGNSGEPPLTGLAFMGTGGRRSADGPTAEHSTLRSRGTHTAPVTQQVLVLGTGTSANGGCVAQQ